MTVGMATATANAALDSIFGTVWMKLHVGDPGPAGLLNAAVNTERKQFETAAAASAAAVTNSAALLWENVPATETYSHSSFWSALSGGTFVGSGTITGGAVTAGADFRIEAGSYTISLTPAS